VIFPLLNCNLYTIATLGQAEPVHISMNALSKRFITGLSERTGLNRFLRYYNRNNRKKLLVLCYHGVVSDSAALDPYLYRNAIPLSEFDLQLRVLQYWFHPISGQELINALSADSQLPPNAVLVTFDDGFRNNLTIAAPVLKSHKVPAIFHVTTESIDTGRPIWPLELDLLILSHPVSASLPLPRTTKTCSLSCVRAERIKVADEIRALCKRLPNNIREKYMNLLRQHSQPLFDQHEELLEFMTWDDVNELSSMGFEIGSHTLSHPILANMEVEEIVRELKESKWKIENATNRPCPWLSYPNGASEDYTALVLEQAIEAGYQIGFTLTQRMCGLAYDHPLEVPRICIASGMTSLDFKSRISGFYELANQLHLNRG